MYTTDKRIRGRRLQRIRERHFGKFPLCVMCNAKGKTVIATELDHIKALINGGEDTEQNRQGLCHTCHEQKTAADLGHAYKETIGLDGYPA